MKAALWLLIFLAAPAAYSTTTAMVKCESELLPTVIGSSEKEQVFYLRLAAAELLRKSEADLKDDIKELLTKVAEGSFQDPFNDPQTKKYEVFFQSVIAHSDIVGRLEGGERLEDFEAEFAIRREEGSTGMELVPMDIADAFKPKADKPVSRIKRFFSRAPRIKFRSSKQFAADLSQVLNAHRLKSLRKSVAKLPYLNHFELIRILEAMDPLQQFDAYQLLAPKLIGELSMYTAAQQAVLLMIAPMTMRLRFDAAKIGAEDFMSLLVEDLALAEYLVKEAEAESVRIADLNELAKDFKPSSEAQTTVLNRALALKIKTDPTRLDPNYEISSSASKTYETDLSAGLFFGRISDNFENPAFTLNDSDLRLILGRLEEPSSTRYHSSRSNASEYLLKAMKLRGFSSGSAPSGSTWVAGSVLAMTLVKMDHISSRGNVQALKNSLFKVVDQYVKECVKNSGFASKLHTFFEKEFQRVLTLPRRKP